MFTLERQQFLIKFLFKSFEKFFFLTAFEIFLRIFLAFDGSLNCSSSVVEVFVKFFGKVDGLKSNLVRL